MSRDPKMIELIQHEFAQAVGISEPELHAVMSGADWARVAEFTEMRRHWAQTMLIGYLRAMLWGSHKVHRIQHHRVPASWWDHLKFACARQWRRTGWSDRWIRRHIRWAFIPALIEYQNLCPHVDVPFAEGAHHVFLAHHGPYAPEPSAEGACDHCADTMRTALLHTGGFEPDVVDDEDEYGS